MEIDYNKFEKIVKVLYNWPENKRQKHKYLFFSEELMKKNTQFRKKALPHICSWLPESTRFDTEIHFAAFIPPWAFSWGDGIIVIDVSAKKWNQNAGLVMNLLIHEIYHLGFVKYNPGFSLKSAGKEKEFIENILWQLQNEGMATWVAYNGRKIFPTGKNEPDYQKLESNAQIDRLFGKLNSLIEKVEENVSKKTQKLVWEIGVKERAFYIVGAYMAKKLEEKKGREFLLKLIKMKPINFAVEYNKLSTSKKRRIYL
jgi:hypothetical protein